MKKLILPLLFLLLLFFESLFVLFLPAGFFTDQKVLSPRFLLISILFLTIYGSNKHGIIYGFIFGLLFDIVYTEILGIYLFLFPLIAYFVSKMMKVLQVNIFSSSIVSLIGVIILEICVFEMNHLIGITSIDFMSFVKMRLVPTLVLNACFVLISAYPLKRQFEKFADSLRAD